MQRSRATILLLTGLAIISGAVITLVETLVLDLGLWAAYSFLILVGEGLLYLGWKLVEREGAAKKLFTLALFGLALRIGIGVVLYQGLPRWGYNETAQRAGYVYWDAYKRDSDAYAIARSDQPLSTAYSSSRISDQYGGLLAFSALIYRYSPVSGHHPLLVVIPLAAISTLAILFTWGFLRRAVSEQTAWIGAWIIVLYPEAILLSASQMREPFLMTAVALTLYGYSYMRKGQVRQAALLLGAAVGIFTLPISPPTVLILFALVALAWIWDVRDRPRLILGILIPGLALAIFAMIITARAWAVLEGVQGSLWQVTQSWLANATAQWRINLVSSRSDLLDVVLDRLPSAVQVPFLVTFGLLQPFLPAAIIAPGAAIWKIVGIWRSIGWFLSLPVLLFATIKGLRLKDKGSLVPFLVIIFWVAAIVSSYRAPSYQWDNPRYRATFIVVQAGLMAWAWVHAKQSKDVWFGRILYLFAIPTVVVTLWYFGRYSGRFSMSLEITAALSVGLIALALLIMFIRDFRDRRSFVGNESDETTV